MLPLYDGDLRQNMSERNRLLTLFFLTLAHSLHPRSHPHPTSPDPLNVMSNAVGSSRLSPAQCSLTVQNRGLKHHSFHSNTVGTNGHSLFFLFVSSFSNKPQPQLVFFGYRNKPIVVHQINPMFLITRASIKISS